MHDPERGYSVPRSVSWRGALTSAVFLWASTSCKWQSFISNPSQRLCVHVYKWRSHPRMWPHSSFQSQYLLSLTQVPDKRGCSCSGCNEVLGLCCRKAGGISCLKVKVRRTGREAAVSVLDSIIGLHCTGVLWLYARYPRLRSEKLSWFKNTSVESLPSLCFHRSLRRT